MSDYAHTGLIFPPFFFHLGYVWSHVRKWLVKPHKLSISLFLTDLMLLQVLESLVQYRLWK